MPMTEAAIDTGLTRDVLYRWSERLEGGEHPALEPCAYYKPFVETGSGRRSVDWPWAVRWRRWIAVTATSASEPPRAPVSEEPRHEPEKALIPLALFLVASWRCLAIGLTRDPWVALATGSASDAPQFTVSSWLQP